MGIIAWLLSSGENERGGNKKNIFEQMGDFFS
jgi:hypothetical protein